MDGKQSGIFLWTTFVQLLFVVACFADADESDIYDFVIVGGGIGGCVLASLLSESGKHSVLLLEAGGVPHPDFDIPALSTQNYEKYARIYKSVPQENVGRTNGGIISAMLGRAVGGASSINGMVWNRGSPHDYDSWAELTNDPSWSYANMLKYFKKLETYSGEFPSSDQHGDAGPITISQPQYSPGLQEWLKAGEELGYKIADPNGPQSVSYTPFEFSKKRGRRQSAYSQYLKPALLDRANLQLITFAEATQVLFEGKRPSGSSIGCPMNPSRNLSKRKCWQERRS